MSEPKPVYYSGARDTNAPACSAPAWPYVVVAVAMAAAVWVGWRLR